MFSGREDQFKNELRALSLMSSSVATSYCSLNVCVVVASDSIQNPAVLMTAETRGNQRNIMCVRGRFTPSTTFDVMVKAALREASKHDCDCSSFPIGASWVRERIGIVISCSINVVFLGHKWVPDGNYKGFTTLKDLKPDNYTPETLSSLTVYGHYLDSVYKQ